VQFALARLNEYEPPPLDLGSDETEESEASGEQR
jgi:hypothetical protein